MAWSCLGCGKEAVDFGEMQEHRCEGRRKEESSEGPTFRDILIIAVIVVVGLCLLSAGSGAFIGLFLRFFRLAAGN